MGPLETCSQEAIKVVFDVNLFGTINTIQAFLPGMKCRKAGKIIITSSVGALQGEEPCGGIGSQPRLHSPVPKACCVLHCPELGTLHQAQGKS